MNENTIINNIKLIRNQKMISQKDFSKKLDMSIASYQRIEQGTTKLTIEFIQKIAKALEVPFEKLLEKKCNIISFINQKGGTGKTTLCCFLATSLKSLMPDKKIAIIDCDFQNSMIEIYKSTDKPIVEVINFDLKKTSNPNVDVLDVLEEAKKENDIILVDTAGSFVMASFMLTILSESDLAIIPMEPTKVSITGSVLTSGLLEEAKERRERKGKDIDALGVLNRVSKNSIELKHAQDLNDVGGIKLMTAKISNLKRYSRELQLNSPIVDSSKKSDEFNIFVAEVINKIGL